jgi:hypothetical protein
MMNASGGTKINLADATLTRCTVNCSGGTQIFNGYCTEELTVNATGGSQIDFDVSEETEVTPSKSGGARITTRITTRKRKQIQKRDASEKICVPIAPPVAVAVVKLEKKKKKKLIIRNPSGVKIAQPIPKGYEDTLNSCIVCLTNIAGVISESCGHHILCIECAEKYISGLKENNQQCSCGSPFTSFLVTS